MSSVLQIISIALFLTLQVSSQDDSQLDSLRQQNKLRPGNFQVLIQLAALLHQLDHSNPDGGSRIAEAELAYRAAIAAAPNDFAVSVLSGNLGALLLSAGRLPEALEELEITIQIGGRVGKIAEAHTAGAMFNRGKVLSAMGEAGDAQKAYRMALASAEGSAPGTWTKCFAAIKEHTPVEVSSMEAAAACFLSDKGSMVSTEHSKRGASSECRWLEDTSLQDQSWLFFALYAAHERKRLYDKAWEALITGNRLQSESQETGGSQDEKLLQALKAIFPVPSQQQSRSSTYEALLGGAGGCMDDSPIFVVGMPRSGSTLVEQILASHPDVAGAGEDTALAPLIPRLLSVLEGRGKGHVSFSEIAAVGEAYVTTMRSRYLPASQKSRIVDKMLRNAWNVAYIAMMLPKARVIWAVRHPLAVVLSCFAQPFEGRGTPWAWDLQEIAHQLELTHQIMTHWEQLLPGKILRVSYEALVESQEQTTRGMLHFCGLPWNKAVVQFHKTKRDVSTASQSQVRESLYTTSVDKWKQYEGQLAEVQQRLRPLITAYEEGASQQWQDKEL